MAASYRSEGRYEAWLLRIAWRQFLSAQRRRPTLMDLDETVTFTPDEAARIDVNRALARLPERERAAALLCFAHGYSHGQAAAVMELPLGTLKSIVARARKALIGQLEGHGQ